MTIHSVLLEPLACDGNVRVVFISKINSLDDGPEVRSLECL
jgi:hypothetical protein